MPGAGSLKSVIYLNTTAPADGTVMVTFSSALINEALTAPERVRADFRAYGWIGNVSEDVRVCYVWGASGVRNWQGMIGRQKPLFMGATASGTAGNADTGMLQHLFGVKINQVQGYAGSAAKRLAVERPETATDFGRFPSADGARAVGPAFQGVRQRAREPCGRFARRLRCHGRRSRVPRRSAADEAAGHADDGR